MMDRRTFLRNTVVGAPLAPVAIANAVVPTVSPTWAIGAATDFAYTDEALKQMIVEQTVLIEIQNCISPEDLVRFKKWWNESFPPGRYKYVEME